MSRFDFVGGYDGRYYDEILELVDGEWRQVATMRTSRYYHTAITINICRAITREIGIHGKLIQAVRLLT